MILLVGPDNWVRRVKRLLTDRTTSYKTPEPAYYQFKLPPVKVVTKAEELRGWSEHIEIVACTEGWNPNREQLDLIALALWHNNLRKP